MGETRWTDKVRAEDARIMVAFDEMAGGAPILDFEFTGPDDVRRSIKIALTMDENRRLLRMLCDRYFRP